MNITFSPSLLGMTIILSAYNLLLTLILCCINFIDTFSFDRYEGEWLQNNMEGHGVVEVDIPDAEPVPGSKYVYDSYSCINKVIRVSVFRS